MIGIQPDMNVGKQIRKFDQRIAEAPSVEAARYLEYLKGLMLASVAAGKPQPASNFIPMYEEEFDETMTRVCERVKRGLTSCHNAAPDKPAFWCLACKRLWQRERKHW